MLNFMDYKRFKTESVMFPFQAYKICFKYNITILVFSKGLT